MPSAGNNAFGREQLLVDRLADPVALSPITHVRIPLTILNGFRPETCRFGVLAVVIVQFGYRWRARTRTLKAACQKRRCGPQTMPTTGSCEEWRANNRQARSDSSSTRVTNFPIASETLRAYRNHIGPKAAGSVTSTNGRPRGWIGIDRLDRDR